MLYIGMLVLVLESWHKRLGAPFIRMSVMVDEERVRRPEHCLSSVLCCCWLDDKNICSVKYLLVLLVPNGSILGHVEAD